MELDGFCDWLMEKKGLSKRSAKDVVSRLRRTLLILEADTIDESSLAILRSSKRFEECSVFIKPQLKRSVALYREFTHD